MRRRVVVTGMGAITPIGNSVEEFWNAVREEKTGFGEITHFDASGYKCHLAAEVKNFDGKNYMDPKAAKRMELFCQYAVAATKEAVADAGLVMEKEDPYLVGTAIGSGVGSLQAIEREYKKLLEKGQSTSGADDDFQHGSRQRVDPVWLQGKKHQRCDGLCDWYQHDRRGVPEHPVRGSGCHDRRRYGGQHLSDRNCRIYGADGTVVRDRSEAMLPAV